MSTYTFNEMPHEDLNQNFDMINAGSPPLNLLVKALGGDMVFKCTPATAAPSAAAAAEDDIVYTVTVTLESAAGEVHSWYNGPVLLAIADTDDVGAATIDPAAGERNMTNGVLEVEVTLPKAAWTAGKTVTLTVADPATAGTGICGWAVANKTFVATLGA
jgi:hypothetical protein